MNVFEQRAKSVRKDLSSVFDYLMSVRNCVDPNNRTLYNALTNAMISIANTQDFLNFAFLRETEHRNEIKALSKKIRDFENNNLQKYIDEALEEYKTSILNAIERMEDYDD